METWVAMLLPLGLVFARTTAFFSALPLFSLNTVPWQVKVGVSVVVAIFLAALVPAPAVGPQQAGLFGASVLVVQEVACGLALGLAARLIFAAIQQGGMLIGREMGFAMSYVFDPATGEETEEVGQILETIFILLFLAAGGHHLLIRLIARSYDVFPVGGALDYGAMAEAVVAAGSAMLLFALKLAAPLMAAFLVLGVVLGVLARVLPEMDILLTSLPLRVGMGLVMTVALVPVLQTFCDEIMQWMGRFL